MFGPLRPAAVLVRLYANNIVRCYYVLCSTTPCTLCRYMCLSPRRSCAVDLFCHFLKRKESRAVSQQAFVRGPNPMVEPLALWQRLRPRVSLSVWLAVAEARTREVPRDWVLAAQKARRVATAAKEAAVKATTPAVQRRQRQPSPPSPPPLEWAAAARGHRGRGPFHGYGRRCARALHRTACRWPRGAAAMAPP